MTDLVQRENEQPSIRRFDNIKTTSKESEWFHNFFNGNTKRSYLRAVKDFCKYLGIKTKDELRSVQPAHVIAYRDYLHNQGLKESTIGNRLSGLSSLFDDLVKNQILQFNLAASVKRPKYHHNKVLSQRLTEQQTTEMLNGPNKTTLKGLRDWVFLSILFGIGCRISEVCGLSVKDKFQDAEYYVLKFMVKGGKEHTVAISSPLQKRINQYLMMSGHGDDPESPLLLNYSPAIKEKLKHITTMTGTRIWDQYKVLEGTTPHSSRTTFASDAIKRGESLVNVQETLAHADPRTTQKYNKNEFNYQNSVALGAKI